jgi:hypothetical protein
MLTTSCCRSHFYENKNNSKNIDISKLSGFSIILKILKISVIVGKTKNFKNIRQLNNIRNVYIENIN